MLYFVNEYNLLLKNMSVTIILLMNMRVKNNSFTVLLRIFKMFEA
jgi:hypothetical protein